MSGTIRRNGDNSEREMRRARIATARRTRARDRAEARAYDDYALKLRTGDSTAR